jgi:hypothetical protein
MSNGQLYTDFVANALVCCWSPTAAIVVAEDLEKWHGFMLVTTYARLLFVSWRLAGALSIRTISKPQRNQKSGKVCVNVRRIVIGNNPVETAMPTAGEIGGNNVTIVLRNSENSE